MRYYLLLFCLLLSLASKAVYSISPYAWCANNPVRNVDLDGKKWLDIDGNQIDEHSNIQVYIFYNSKKYYFYI